MAGVVRAAPIVNAPPPKPDNFASDPQVYKSIVLRQIADLIRIDRKAGKLALARYLTRFPEDWEALDIAGTNLMTERKWKPAAAAFERALRVHPHSAALMAKMGVATLMVGDRARGIGMLEKSIEADPTNPLALRYLSWNAFDRGLLAEAVDYSERLLSQPSFRDGALTQIHLDLARLYNSLGRYADTIRLLRRSMSSEDRGDDPLAAYGLLLKAAIGSNDANLGRDVLRRAMAIAHTDVDRVRLGLAEAQLLHLEGRDEQVVRALEELRRAYPAHAATVAFSLAGFYLERQDRQAAAEELRSLIEKSAALTGKAGDEPVGDPVDGDLDHRNAVAVAVAAMHRLAKIRFQDKKDDEAVALLQRAVALAPPDRKPVLLRDLAAAMTSSGRQPAALRLIDDYAERFPGYPAIPYLKAEILAEANESEKARSVLKKLVSAAPDYAAAHYLSGMLYWRSGQLAEGEASLRKAIALEPQMVGAWQGLAEIVHSREGDRAMLRVLDEATRANPSDLKLLRQYAAVAYSEGELSVAGPVYRRLLKIQGAEVGALTGLALSLADRASSPESLSEAEALARRAMSASSGDSPLALDALGWVKLRQGRVDEGMEDLTRALKLMPDDAGILYHLGIGHRKRNELDSARAMFRKALTAHAPKHYREAMIRELSSR